MLRWFIGTLMLVLAANVANAHFFFLLPGAAKQSPTLVLSDSPVAEGATTPSTTASLDWAQTGKFMAVSRTGDGSPLTIQRTDAGTMTFSLLPAETARVQGTVDYGVVVRGQAEPVMIRHHAKLVTNMSITEGTKTPPLPVEINVLNRANGVQFQVMAFGKPVVADVSVYVPESKRVEVVSTDVAGMTKPFDKKGQYAARVLITEKKNGEFQGRPYRVVRHYATVVASIE